MCLTLDEIAAAVAEDPEEDFEFKLDWMTAAEYDDVPEFGGW